MYRNSAGDATGPNAVVRVKPGLDKAVTKDEAESVGPQEVLAVVDPDAPVGFDAYFDEVLAP